MVDPSQNDASLRPVLLRDDLLPAVKAVVTMMGGVSVAAARFGVTRQTVWNWIRGATGIPPAIADMLAVEALAIAATMIEAQKDLIRLEAHARARRMALRRENRERYYARFGRYPVPARGNKTP